MRELKTYFPILRIGLIALVVFTINLGSKQAFALTSKEVEVMESIVKKHSLGKDLKPIQLFQGYAIIARELEAYGFQEKAADYYQKALKANPSDKRALEVATSYLSNLYRRNPKSAKKYYGEEYQSFWKASASPLKNQLKEFWENAFKEEVDPKNHVGFYGQFFKDRDIKDLVSEEKFFEAYSLLKPNGLEESNINNQLQYDVLSFINGKKNGFYCEAMLKRFPKSPSVPVEMCRYLKSRQLKYGDLDALLKRSQKELPHLSYLVKALVVRPNGGPK